MLREQNVDAGIILATAPRQFHKAVTGLRSKKEASTIVVKREAKA